MNALPAIDLKHKPGEERKTVRARTRIATRGKKVLKLPLPKPTPKPRGLSEAKKTELVLEYRQKARKLARSILRRWHARLDLEEVDSVVDLSLCEAVKRYNPSKGASFMTFLYYHLRGNLIRTVSTAASANSVPLPDSETLDGLISAHGSGRASYRGINAVEVAEALCNHDNLLPDEMLFKKELAQLSLQACTSLDSLEREVIHRIYMEEQQLMDIARSLGYSRCHISRVKKKALETLYYEMKNSTHGDGTVPANRGAEEEEELETRPNARRVIQRRRPRAGKPADKRKHLELVRAVG